MDISQTLLDMLKRVQNIERRLATGDRVASATLKVVQKGTAGTPAAGVEGQISINTVDNTVHVYGFGGWRQVYPGPGVASITTTALGGLAVKLIAGEDLVVGNTVYNRVAGGADGTVWRTQVGEDMGIGAVYAAVSTGDPVWVVVAGIGYLLPLAATTAVRGYVAYCGAEVGRVDQAAAVPAIATHVKEMGHFINTGGGAGVATLAIIHQL